MAANTAVDSGAGGVCSTSEAIRVSVAKTQVGYGNAVAVSAVYSETQDLRVAYPGEECNIPAIA